MTRLWLISNRASGSTSSAGRAAIDAAISDHGAELVGETDFPREPLPSVVDLERLGIHMLLLFAGDGTINAAACALDGWGGRVLILPGGTMNMLSKLLHGDRPPAAILQDALAQGRDMPLPCVEAGPHRAFVALIVGPVAAWAHAREAVRKGQFRRLGRALRYAFLRTFSRGVRVAGAQAVEARHQAVVIMPTDDGLDVSAIGLKGWMSAARIGLDWLAGDWRAGPYVAASHTQAVVLGGARRLHALFDGEEAKLASPLRVTRGQSRLRFVTTLAGRA